MTVPLAELLLTKLQIIHLNEKDQRDILALLGFPPARRLGDDVISAQRTCELLADD